MKKNAIIIIDFVGRKAGLDLYDISLGEALVKAGCDVAVYGNFNSSLPFVKKVFPFRIRTTVLTALNYYLKAKKIIRTLSASDLLILHIFHFSRFNASLLKYASRRGVRAAIIVHDVQSFVYKTESSIIRQACALAHRIFVHNEFTRSELLQAVSPHDADRLSVIRHGHFAGRMKLTEKREARRRMGIPPGRKVFLFFGMVKPSKGLELLLEAMRHTGDNVHLVVAGRLRGMKASAFEKLVAANGLGDRVQLHFRYIDTGERDLFFSAADAIVLPYSKIYQSGVLMLAMSSGVPVICSDLPPNRELITDGVTGLLFAPGDVAGLAKSMKRLAGDEVLAEEMAKNAEKKVEEEWGWEGAAEVLKSNF